MRGKTIKEEREKIDMTSEPIRLIINLNAETARGAAIVGVAYLEDLIKRYLKAKLVYFNKGIGIIDNLTFERKTILCYMIGIIDKETMSDLLDLSRIRNKFAHIKDANDFSRIIDGLNIPSTLDNLNFMKFYKKERRLSISPRSKYEDAIYYYFGFLDDKIKKCKRIRSPELLDE